MSKRIVNANTISTLIVVPLDIIFKVEVLFLIRQVWPMRFLRNLFSCAKE